MAEKIGQIIKKVAEGQGYSQKGFGEKINKTKQGVASIYRRATIDTQLLLEVSIVLDYDFFAHFYSEPGLQKFKNVENSKWQDMINQLVDKLKVSDKLISSQEETLIVQRKLIAQLEEKIDRRSDNG